MNTEVLPACVTAVSMHLPGTRTTCLKAASVGNILGSMNEMQPAKRADVFDSGAQAVLGLFNEQEGLMGDTPRVSPIRWVSPSG